MLTHTSPSSWAGPLEGEDPWPLRFHRHSFRADCFNTLACSIVYDHREFGTRWRDVDAEYDSISPSVPPGWPESWDGRGVILVAPESHGGMTFPGPVDLQWRSMDGTDHVTAVDLDTIFKDRLVAHNVPKDDIPEAWLSSRAADPITPQILMMIDNRTIGIYMRAKVLVKDGTDPADERSHHRADVIRIWSRTF